MQEDHDKRDYQETFWRVGAALCEHEQYPHERLLALQVARHGSKLAQTARALLGIPTPGAGSHSRRKPAAYSRSLEVGALLSKQYF